MSPPRLTIDAALGAFTSCSRAHFRQTQEEDLRRRRKTHFLKTASMSFFFLKRCQIVWNTLKPKEQKWQAAGVGGWYLWVLRAAVPSFSHGCGAVWGRGQETGDHNPQNVVRMRGRKQPRFTSTGTAEHQRKQKHWETLEITVMSKNESTLKGLTSVTNATLRWIRHRMTDLMWEKNVDKYGNPGLVLILCLMCSVELPNTESV